MAKRLSCNLADFRFARTFAFAWFRFNKIAVNEKATPEAVAIKLHCWDGSGQQTGAMKAIIKWHHKALSTNKADPEVKIDSDFYASQAWRKARYEVLKRCHGACELCGAPPGQYALHVDHVLPRSKFPEYALEPSNLQVLCRDCNLGKSNNDTTDWRIKRPIREAATQDDNLGFYSEESIAQRLRALR